MSIPPVCLAQFLPNEPVEHQWWLARYVADDLRGETRNVGVILRAANLPMPKIQLLDPVSFLRPEHHEEWKGWASYWRKVWDEHGGTKPFYWIAKPSKHSPHFFWQMGGARIVSVVDFEEMFSLLVKPENR